MSGPAFPTGNQQEWGPDGGMTLRDYIAAKALSGMLASEGDDAGYYTDTAHAAQRAYDLADAMLMVRAKGGEA